MTSSKVIIVGNGPSSWGLKPLDIIWLQLRGYEVAVCNHRDLPSDVVFVHDRPMLRHIHLVESQRVATFRRFLNDRALLPGQVIEMPPGAEGVYSCGGLAIVYYATRGVDEMHLIGFDGSHDVRTIDGCRGNTTHAYDNWHLRVVSELRGMQNNGKPFPDIHLVLNDPDRRHPLASLSNETWSPHEWKQRAIAAEFGSDARRVSLPRGGERPESGRADVEKGAEASPA